jgi:hypothetical protein
MTMIPTYQTDLYQRIHAGLRTVKVIDCHEHLQRETELPTGDNIHIGRFFVHYANCDLVSAGMPQADMTSVQTDPKLTPRERFALLAPWYQKTWNTAYCESLRIAWRDLYDIEDLTAATVDGLTDKMRKLIRPGFTRQVFDKAGIDFAMTNPFGPGIFLNPDFDSSCFMVDMTEDALNFPIAQMAQASGIDILDLADYLKAIDWYFEHYASQACAFKVVRAYDRSIYFEDVPRSAVEKTFLRLNTLNESPSRQEILLLEDHILHYLCRKCKQYNLRMKFHTGLQEGNGNIIRNSRAALLTNLFLKYPHTGFDLFHISYPYQEELVTLAKNFPNVTVDFCWMWIINPAAGRRALSDMLDAIPASKIHAFGGDYIFVEGSYGHLVITLREITRVLCEKVEEGRFTEDYALQVGRMMLRDNPLENFNLAGKRAASMVTSG